MAPTKDALLPRVSTSVRGWTGASQPPTRQAFAMANNVIQRAEYRHTDSSGFVIGTNEEQSMKLFKRKHNSRRPRNAVPHSIALSMATALVKQT